MSVETIAAFFDWHVRTVRETLHRWQRQGLGGLWEAPRPGPQKRWHPEAIEYLETCLRPEPRTYNSEQLAPKLDTERHVQLSPDHLRRVLQKRGGSGSERERATAGNKTPLKKLPNEPILRCCNGPLPLGPLA